MKRTMAWLCVVAVLSAACLCGCGQKVAGESSSRVSAGTKAVESAASSKGEVLLRQDAEALVQVNIEDGEPSIRLNPQQWEALYGDAFREAGQMFGDLAIFDFSDPAFFAPIGRADAVPIRDACIGTVPGFSEWAMYGFPVPVAMLLREDGRVEAVYADPFATHFTSEGMLLPFLEDVEQLYVDVSSGDGRGEPSIYAACANGLLYDLEYLFSHTFSDVFGVEWRCVLAGTPLETTVQLQLFEDGTARLTLFDESGLVAEYVGNHAFVLAAGQEYAPPTLVLDLALEVCNSPVVQARGDIKGAYYYQLGVQDSFLQLWQSFGDALFVGADGTPVAEYWLSGYGQEAAGNGTALPAGFSALYDGDWVTELEPAGDDFDGYQGILRFADETRVELHILSGVNVIDTYWGIYSIAPDVADPEGYHMVFELALGWTMAEAGEGAEEGVFPRYDIKGAYLAKMADGPALHLWLRDGDGLYNNQFNSLDGPQAEYAFALVPHAAG